PLGVDVERGPVRVVAQRRPRSANEAGSPRAVPGSEERQKTIRLPSTEELLKLLCTASMERDAPVRRAADEARHLGKLHRHDVLAIPAVGDLDRLRIARLRRWSIGEAPKQLCAPQVRRDRSERGTRWPVILLGCCRAKPMGTRDRQRGLSNDAVRGK